MNRTTLKACSLAMLLSLGGTHAQSVSTVETPSSTTQENQDSGKPCTTFITMSTLTKAGDALFIKMIKGSPVAAHIFNNRQAAINALLAEPKLIASLTQILATIATLENSIAGKLVVEEVSPEQVRNFLVVTLFLSLAQLDAELRKYPSVHEACSKIIPFVRPIDDNRSDIMQTMRIPKQAALFYGALDILVGAARALENAVSSNTLEASPEDISCTCAEDTCSTQSPVAPEAPADLKE